MKLTKQPARERLRRAERGELSFFWSRYGSKRNGLIVKAVSASRDKLEDWMRRAGIPEKKLFAPGTAMPSVTLTGKQAREALKMLDAQVNNEGRRNNVQSVG